MEKFNKTIYGYDPEEVNLYLDEIISEVAKIAASNKEKNQEIIRLSKELEEARVKAKMYDELKEIIDNFIKNKR